MLTKRILKESLTLEIWSGMMNRSLKFYTGLPNLACFKLTLGLIQPYTKIIKSLGQKEEWQVVDPSFFCEGRFATTATFDDESIVDSSHLLLPTWPCPRWLFQITVNSMKLRFYTEKNDSNPRKQCQLEDINNQSSIRMNCSPRSLASVLEFRYQSLTLKYIEIGLLLPLFLLYF